MCGYLGSITFNPIPENNIEKCNKRIECRGPDEKIIINNKNYKSNSLFHNFAFNRLSIIDLSSKASQPMYSKEFNSLIMFNGEIFNHAELRKKIEKKNIKFDTSHSDTETLLLGLSCFGTSFLDEINGQFSIFFYDINHNEYYLIRDRAGQKPLYYSINKNGIYFGSNLISLKNYSENRSMNKEQVVNYINFGTSISEDTYFENIHKVKPGEFIKFTPEKNKFKIEKNKYWKLSEFMDDKNFIKEEFIDIFEDSVKIRLESDVPVSNFLSGGLDSTAVIKAINKNRDEINTFSLITEFKEYDESIFMDQVVQKYNTRHTYETIGKEVSFHKIKKIISEFDDIIYDPSIIPTYLLSQKISKQYKVALSGDGGDELLSGYAHYANFHSSLKFSKSLVNKAFKIYPPFLGSGNNILKFSKDWKASFSSYYEDRKLMNLLKIKDYQNFENSFLNKKERSWKSIMMSDYEFFLDEMMLKKIDRSSMQNSLEIRSPFIDHRLYEYIISHRYFNNNYEYSQKKIIKDYLKDDFDENFLNRKKMGFSININKIILNNRSEILDTIQNSDIKDFVDLSKINQLFFVKSKFNALRVWKLFAFSEYLNNNKI